MTERQPEHGGPVAGQPPTGPWPSGKALRALTSKARRTHGGGRWTSLFGDAYVVLVVVVVLVSMGVQTASLLGADLANAAAGEEATVILDPAWLAPVAGLAAAGLVFAVLVRLGPVGVGGAGALWWLPTPADRPSLLRPVAIGWLAGGAALGAAGGAVLAGFAHLHRMGVFAILGAGAGIALVSTAILTQRTRDAGLSLARAPVRARRIARAGEACLSVAVAAWAVLALLGPAAPAVPTWLTALAVLVAALVLAAAALRGLGDIPGAVLRARGARTGNASASVQALDLRGLGRVLTDSGPAVRRRLSAMRGVRGPWSAVFGADLRLVARSPWQLIALTAAIGLPIAVAASGGSLLLVAVFAVIGASLAANAGAAGARAAHDAPVFDRAFGLGASQARLARLPLASLIAFGWALAVLWAAFALRGITLGAALVPLAAALAPGLASAGIIAAYRKEMDWSRPLVVTPQGAYPPGLFSSVALGPMVTVIALIPTLVAVAVAVWVPGGAIPPLLVGLQLVVSAILVAVAAYVPRPKTRR